MVNTSTSVTSGGETLHLGIFQGSGSVESLLDELEMTRAELLATRSELERLRSNDLFARIGEADFTVVLPGVSRDRTAGAARRISQAVASSPFDAGVTPISLTVRIGATFSDDRPHDLHHLIEVALGDAASDPSHTVFV